MAGPTRRAHRLNAQAMRSAPLAAFAIGLTLPLPGESRRGAVAGEAASLRQILPNRTDSTCIGDSRTPICAVETFIACTARNDRELCEAFGVSPTWLGRKNSPATTEYVAEDVSPLPEHKPTPQLFPASNVTGTALRFRNARAPATCRTVRPASGHTIPIGSSPCRGPSAHTRLECVEYAELSPLCRRYAEAWFAADPD